MANMVQKIRTTYTLANGLNILKVFASLTYDVETLYIKYSPINEFILRMLRKPVYYLLEYNCSNH